MAKFERFGIIEHMLVSQRSVSFLALQQCLEVSCTTPHCDNWYLDAIVQEIPEAGLDVALGAGQDIFAGDCRYWSLRNYGRTLWRSLRWQL